MKTSNHPLRQSLLDELHLRPFSDFDGAGRFIRFVYLSDGHDSDIITPVTDWLENKDRAPIGQAEKFRREQFDDFALRVERHSEFVTISFIVKGFKVTTGLHETAFDEAAQTELPFSLVKAIPTPLFHAIWVEVGGQAPSDLTPETVTEMLACRASASSLISEGAAQLHCGFDVDQNGYSRAMLFNQSIPPNRMGRVVQRMVELETYRMLALLGLPLVRSVSSELSMIETELQSLTSEVNLQITSGIEDVGRLLPSLSRLAAQAENLSAETSFRLSATTAYCEIFTSRMDRLNISRLDGYQGLYGFLDRRMMPAMQTCNAFSARLDSLSERIGRTGSLLRTQTEFKIQKQNTSLLASMDRRAQAQLRLQQTVEGLSVIAGTYYGVGLVEVVAKYIAPTAVSTDLVKAASLPFVAFLIWLILRRGSQMVHKLDTKK